MFGQIIKRPTVSQLPHPVKVIKPSEVLPAASDSPPRASSAPHLVGPMQPDAAAQRLNYEELHRLEKAVAAHRLSWVMAGRALAEIHRRELYLVRSADFDQYLRERWGLKRRQGYDLVVGARVAENIQQVRHALSLSAAIKLAKLPADEQAACLEAAIAAAGTRSPTASYLAAAVAARLPARTATRAGANRRRKKPRPVRLRLSSGTLTILCKRAETDLRALLEEALSQLPSPKPAAA